MVVLDPLNSKGWSVFRRVGHSFLSYFHTRKANICKCDKIVNSDINIGNKRVKE